MSTRISYNVLINHSDIGKYSYIGPNVILNNAIVGNYCSIAPCVQIGGMEHSYWEISMSPRLSNSCISNNKTVIGNDVWIGASAIIKQGIIIGDGSVIGAGAFVNKNVPENTIVFGVPAKIYKKRFDDETWGKIAKSNYWHYSPKKAKRFIEKLKVISV